MPATFTRIKICGVTNTQDLRAACDAGADAIGFNFVPGSPRFVGADVEAARRLIAATPPLVWRFGLYDTLPDGMALMPGLHAIQYYRMESRIGGIDGSNNADDDVLMGQVPVKAYRVRDASSLREIAEDADPRAMILLDAYAPGKLGGTGHTFNWELAVETKRRFGLPIVLAGGLTPENVGEAVRAVRPYMVDVSSGVEAAEPGRKDADKMRRFVRAVREADLD